MILRSQKLVIIVSILVLAGSGYAQDKPADDEEFEQFLELLEEQTSLATQTRMNADFVPGIVSVIAAEELNSRGFRTVWDALATIPGVLPSMNATGMRSLSVRGVGDIFESGKIKLLLNSKSLNISASTATAAIYDMPVQQVERIEFIRGPGSAIHGEFAFAGVLNVITRKNSDMVSIGLESGDGYLISGLKAFDFADAAAKANLNIALQSTNGEDIASGDDRSTGSIRSYAPGNVNNKRNNVSVIFDVEAASFNAGIQFQQINRGDHFGVNNLLPPDKKQTVISDSVLSLYVGQTVDIDHDLVAEWSINGLQNSLERNALFLGTAEAFGGIAGGDDVVADSLVEETRIEAKFALQYTGERHDIFTELTLSDIRVTESKQFINLDPVTSLPSPIMNEFPGLVDDSLDRSAYSLVIQDQFHLDQRTTLTTGIRYDDYEDIDDNASPRVALVWRESDEHVYKAQIARAFRPPSLIEVGGSIKSSIDPEIIDTVELGYIYNNRDLTIRNTVYYSELIDLITFSETAPLGYSNTSRNKVKGYELEVENSFAMDWRVQTSLTLQDDDSNNLGSVAAWAYKLGVQYKFSPLGILNIQVNSVSRRDRSSSDTRSSFPQATQANLGASLLKLGGISGLSLRLGVDNLFDEEIKFIASENTYVGDYPFSDRRFIWVQLSYSP